MKKKYLYLILVLIAVPVLFYFVRQISEQEMTKIGLRVRLEKAMKNEREIWSELLLTDSGKQYQQASAEVHILKEEHASRMKKYAFLFLSLAFGFIFLALVITFRSDKTKR